MRFALYVALSAVCLSWAGGLRAQPMLQPYYPGFSGLPPHEVLALVRSAGFDPVSRPVRQGPVYVLRALSPADQEVRVVVDARMGRILKVAAVAPTDPGDFAPPQPIPPGRVLPDGNPPAAGGLLAKALGSPGSSAAGGGGGVSFWTGSSSTAGGSLASGSSR